MEIKNNKDIISKNRDLNLILKDIVESLNNNSIKNILHLGLSKETCDFFAEYFISALNLKQARITYEKLSKNEYSKVSEIDNKITISTSMLKPSMQAELLTSIAHELRHVYQNTNVERYKKCNTPVSSMYPMKKCTNDSYNEILDKRIDTTKYYVTSLPEKDARDYANEEVEDLLLQIKQHVLSKNSTKNWADLNLNRLKKHVTKETKNYNKAIAHVNTSFVYLKDIIPKKIDTTISSLDNKFIITKSTYGNDRIFSKYLYFYCDNNITNKIINFSIKTNDLDTLFMCLNHPNTKISEEQFLRMLSFYTKNNKIGNYTTIIKNLTNWNVEEIKRMGQIHNKQFIKEKYKKRKVNTDFFTGKYTINNLKVLNKEEYIKHAKIDKQTGKIESPVTLKIEVIDNKPEIVNTENKKPTNNSNNSSNKKPTNNSNNSFDDFEL